MPSALSDATAYQYWLHDSSGPSSAKKVPVAVPICVKVEMSGKKLLGGLRRMAYEAAPGTAAHVRSNPGPFETAVGNGPCGGITTWTGPASSLSSRLPKPPCTENALTRTSTGPGPNGPTSKDGDPVVGKLGQNGENVLMQ